MKYIEIYINEKYKELEEKQEEILNKLRKDIANNDIDVLIDNILCEYSLEFADISSRKFELDQFKKDLLGDKENE